MRGPIQRWAACGFLVLRSSSIKTPVASSENSFCARTIHILCRSIWTIKTTYLQSKLLDKNADDGIFIIALHCRKLKNHKCPQPWTPVIVSGSSDPCGLFLGQLKESLSRNSATFPVHMDSPVVQLRHTERARLEVRRAKVVGRI